MTRNPVFVALATATILAACDATDSGQQGSAKTAASSSTDPGARAVGKADPATLPHLTGPDGTRYPYFEYASSSLVGDDALAVFVFPVFDSREKGLALPHGKTQDIGELFATDELLGTSFSVVSKAGTWLVDGLPVSRPIDLKADSKWVMPYAGATLDCSVVSRTGVDVLIKCASKDTEFRLEFNDQRGFTRYQDFCRKQICTYTLESSVGLLSPYHLEAVAPQKQDQK